MSQGGFLQPFHLLSSSQQVEKEGEGEGGGRRGAGGACQEDRKELKPQGACNTTVGDFASIINPEVLWIEEGAVV